MLGFLKSGYQKVKRALAKTRSFLAGSIRSLFSKPWDEQTLHQLEEILFEADLGSQVITELLDKTRSVLSKNKDAKIDDILDAIRSRCLELLQEKKGIESTIPAAGEPYVMLIVGVNGSGKTTTLAKLAKHFKEDGKKVLIAAADTFRAAAIDQLDIWAKRIGVDIVKGQPGSDPSAVAFDALTAAKARGCDLVMIDTAGRLQNKTDLMRELEKIRRVCGKVVPSSPHETLLVLDATTGQNALDQARVFHQFTPINGIVLAKLDGSAKGGIVLGIYKELGIPVRWMGTGEKEDDLAPFHAEEFVSAMFE